MEYYDSALRAAGDLGVFFEADEEAGYFYAFDNTAPEGHKVLSDIKVWIGPPPVPAEDVKVAISSDQSAGGLFVQGKLWAAFDFERQRRSGGCYTADGAPSVSTELQSKFFRG